MIVSILPLIITLVMLFTLPTDYFPITGLFLYSLLIIWNLYRRQFSLLNAVLVSIYACVSCVYYIGNYTNLIPFTGSLFYASLSFVMILGGILKMPFTIKKSTKEPPTKDVLLYHRLLNIIMGSIYFLALYFSITLFPKPTYIVIPIILSIVAVPFSIIISKRLVPKINDFTVLKNYKSKILIQDALSVFDNSRGLCMESGEYIVKEVKTSCDKVMFFDALELGYLKLFQDSEYKRSVKYADFFLSLKNEYSQYENISSAFVAVSMATKKAVGTIRVITHGVLPLENDIAISLDQFRECNHRIAEVGRFSIHHDGVQKGEIAKLLLNAAISKLYIKNIEVLFMKATMVAYPIYEKMGITDYGNTYYCKELGQHTRLCYLNLLSMATESDVLKSFSEFRNTPIAQLYIQRYIRNQRGIRSLTNDQQITELIRETVRN